MKNTIFGLTFVFATLMLTSPAHAVDTSGCSQTNDNRQQVKTVQNKLLTVESSLAPHAGCWNQNSGSIRINLQWSPSAPENDNVTFYVSVNGEQRSVQAQMRCDVQKYYQGTSGVAQSQVICSANASIPMNAVGSVKVEVAPVVNGSWDTAGYGKNYQFSL